MKLHLHSIFKGLFIPGSLASYKGIYIVIKNGSLAYNKVKIDVAFVPIIYICTHIYTTGWGEKPGLSMFWTKFSKILFCSDFGHKNKKCDKKIQNSKKMETNKNKIRETKFFGKK